MKVSINFFFIIITTLLLASEDKIPNVFITENPSKKVETVVGLKNKEVAELNIKIKKKDIDEIAGIDTPDGTLFTLQQNPNRGLGMENIVVVKSLDNIEGAIGNNKGKNRGKRSVPSNIVQSTIEESSIGEKLITVPKLQDNESVYIVRLINNSIDSVFKGSSGGAREESVERVEATLDMTQHDINQWSRWETLGNPNSTDGVAATLKFSSGQPPKQPQGGISNKTPITKLIVKSRGVEKIVEQFINRQYQVEFDKNIIGIDPFGRMFISKLAESDEPETYEIEVYHQNTPLGSLVLTIKNSTIVDGGEIEVKIDERLRSKRKNWIYADGGLTRSPNIAPDEEYPYLIDIAGEFRGFENTRAVESTVELEGREFLGVNSSSHNSGMRYGIFTINGENWIDESAFPYLDDIRDLKRYIVVSMNNSNNLNLLNNRFRFKGENGVIYKGNIEERYMGERAKIGGELKIDTSGYSPGKRVEIERGLSEGDSINSGVRMRLIGELPNPGAINRSNIITSLVISKDETTQIVDGTEYIHDGKFKIKILPNGNIEYTKLESMKNVTLTLTIKYMYKDIDLGEFILEVVDKTEFEILGDGFIDIGDIIQGQKATVYGDLRIRNLNRKEIVNITLNQSEEFNLLHKDDRGIVLKSKANVIFSANDEGIEVPVRVRIETQADSNQELGEYNGELNLLIEVK